MKDQENQVKEKVSIHIDKKHFFAPSDDMTGAELKALAGIGSDCDLWKEEHGQKDDTLINDTDIVHLKSGDSFFASPKSLNPGSN
jgi:hypothetical protein